MRRLRRLPAAVFLQIFQNRSGLLRWKIGSHPHVEHDCLPLRCGSFGRITFGMAAVAMNRVQLRAAEFMTGWDRGLRCRAPGGRLRLTRNGIGARILTTCFGRCSKEHCTGQEHRRRAHTESQSIIGSFHRMNKRIAECSFVCRHRNATHVLKTVPVSARTNIRQPE
jgi:hypothetical protein